MTLTFTLVGVVFLVAAILATVALIREDAKPLGTWALVLIAWTLTLLSFGVLGLAPLK